jgi:hypothetical protein
MLCTDMPAFHMDVCVTGRGVGITYPPGRPLEVRVHILDIVYLVLEVNLPLLA